MRRALVVGCGYVGAALGRSMSRAGWSVAGLRRDPRRLPGDVVPIAADVGDPVGLASALAAASPDSPDVVVYAVSADERTESGYRAAYVDGARNLFQAFQDRDLAPRRLLYVSSTAVYGGRDGARVDEETPLEPRGFRQEVLVEGEERALDGPVPAVVLRLAGIYGPGRTRLVRKVREGRAACPPGPPIYTNRVHRDDAAGMLAHLATLENPAEIYLGVDRDPADLCTVYRWLAEEMGVPAPRPGAEGVEDRRRRSNKRCSGARIVASGYVVQYPTFREGYGALLADRAAGEPADGPD